MIWAIALLKRIWLPLVLVVLICAAFSFALLAAYGKGLKRGDERTDSAWLKRWNEQLLVLAAARVKAVETARAEEQRRYAVADQQGEIARETNRQIDRDAADRSADDGLRSDAAVLARQCSADPAVAQRGESSRRAAMVLSELLERSLTTNRELAEAYDRVRTAAIACNSTVDAWRDAK